MARKQIVLVNGMKTFNEGNRQDRVHIIVLVVATIAGWLLWLGPYQLVGDDFQLNYWMNIGLADVIQERFGLYGIRRSVGMIVNAPITALPATMIGAVCVSMHAICATLFYFVARKTLRSGWLSLIAAVMFGVYPYGYGAVVYAAGSYVIPLLMLFFANLLLLWQIAGAPENAHRTRWLAGLSSLLAFLCCLVGEHLIFAIAISGLFVYVTTGQSIRWTVLKRALYWVAAPCVGVGIFAVAAVMTKPQKAEETAHQNAIKRLIIQPNEPHDKPLKFNPRTLLSVTYYQHRHASVHQVWLSSRAWELTFRDWSFTRTGMAGALAFALFLAARKVSFDLHDSRKAAPVNWAVGGMLVVFILCFSGIHALAGGYSAASRHQYVPLPLYLLFIAWVFGVLLRSRTLPAGCGKMLLSCVLVFGIISTWIVTSAYRYEVERYSAILSAILENNVAGPVKIVCAPEWFAEYPALRKTTILDIAQPGAYGFALDASRRPRIYSGAGPDGQVIDVRDVNRTTIVTTVP